MYIYTYTHIHIQVRIHTYIYTYMHTCVGTALTPVSLSPTRIKSNLGSLPDAGRMPWTYVCMYVCVYVCMWT